MLVEWRNPATSWSPKSMKQWNLWTSLHLPYSKDSIGGKWISHPNPTRPSFKDFLLLLFCYLLPASTEADRRDRKWSLTNDNSLWNCPFIPWTFWEHNPHIFALALYQMCKMIKTWRGLNKKKIFNYELDCSLTNDLKPTTFHPTQ